jgi:hypothetical protein
MVEVEVENEGVEDRKEAITSIHCVYNLKSMLNQIWILE